MVLKQYYQCTIFKLVYLVFVVVLVIIITFWSISKIYDSESLVMMFLRQKFVFKFFENFSKSSQKRFIILKIEIFSEKMDRVRFVRLGLNLWKYISLLMAQTQCHHFCLLTVWSITINFRGDPSIITISPWY